MEHVHALPPGTRLEEYEIETVLGSGGFAITYRAHDTHLNTVVALKEYLPRDCATRTNTRTVVPTSEADRADYEWGLTRFEEEGRALARFENPHLNKVHRFFKAHGTAYLVLEYIEGETLSAALQRHGTLSQSRIERLLGELLSGLEEVHEVDYVHRDLKPDNIMLRSDGSAVILDFGAARQAVGQRTKSARAVLTPGYAPIEQHASSQGTADEVGPWSDLYALGMVAYRCVSGVGSADLPNAVTRSQAARKGGRDILPAVEVGQGRYDRQLLAAIDWAIEVDKEDRPQSVEAWRGALAGEHGEERRSLVEDDTAGGVVRQEGEAVPGVRRSERIGRVIGAVMVIAVLGGGAYFLAQTDSLADRFLVQVGALADWFHFDRTYELTITTNVEQPEIQLIDTGPYQEGMTVGAGQYRIRVSSPGYNPVEREVEVGWWAGSTFHIELEEIPEVTVTISTTPSDARVSFPDLGVEYAPGLSLPVGDYRIAVTKSGYQDIDTRISVSPGNAQFSFDLEVTTYTLHITTEPSDAEVRLVGVSASYRPGMRLPRDRYQVRVSRRGYVARDVTIHLTEDTNEHVILEVTTYALRITTEPSDAEVRLVGVSAVYHPGIQLPRDRYQVQVSRRGYVARDVTVHLTRDTNEHVTLVRDCRTVQVPKTKCDPVTRYEDETRERVHREDVWSFSDPVIREGIPVSEVCRIAERQAESELESDCDGDLRVVETSCNEIQCTFMPGTCVSYNYYGQCTFWTEIYTCTGKAEGICRTTETYTERVPYTDQECRRVMVDEQRCIPL